MLGNKEAVATIAVKDLAVGRKFYEGQGDVHVFGDLKNAWFKDPDGNILALVNR
jgi:hypothetical protein